MKYKIFSLFWVAVLAFFSTVVGVLAYLGRYNAEVIFWTGNPIESNEGKIAWILISLTVLIITSALAVITYRQSNN